MPPSAPPPKLRAQPLRDSERGALANALRKAGLPVDDLDVPGRLFFRFERLDDMPVGFGGLEIFGPAALLRSVITLPPLRGQGLGGAIVAALEAEAAMHKCTSVYLLTIDAIGFFERLGYTRCERADLPASIRDSRQFTALCPDDATAMVKRIS